MTHQLVGQFQGFVVPNRIRAFHAGFSVNRENSFDRSLYPACCRLVLNNIVTTVISKHLPYIVAWNSGTAMTVKADQIREPGLIMHVFKKRCVGNHRHNILILFDACKICCLGKCSVKLCGKASDYGNLSDEDLRSLAVIAVIEMGVLRKILCRIVIMFINDRRRQSFFL